MNWTGSDRRLRAVRRAGLLDTPPEEAFDKLTRLARDALHVPFAFITVVDEQRSFWKSRVGVDPQGPSQNTVEESFCQYVVSSGEPLVLGDVRVDPLTMANPSIESMGVVAWAGYPVHAPDGEVLGTFCVVDTAPRAWSGGDRQLLETLASAASTEVALRQVATEARRARVVAERLHAQQMDLSVRLQQAMLTEPPRVGGIEVAVRYRPAAAEAQVGGDWYDAFNQPDGSGVFVVGDVAGHDVAAAVTMGQLRSLVRSIGYDSGAGPAEILQRSDAAMRGLDIDTIASAVVVHVMPEPSDESPGRTVCWSSAGHPPPVLVRADGRAEVLGADRYELLLGVRADTDRTDSKARLLPGDTLVLYTDGLIERRGVPLPESLHDLVRALDGLHGLPPDALCDGLLARLLPAPGDDDVALLAVRVRGAD